MPKKYLIEILKLKVQKSLIIKIILVRTNKTRFSKKKHDDYTTFSGVLQENYNNFQAYLYYHACF